MVFPRKEDYQQPLAQVSLFILYRVSDYSAPDAAETSLLGNNATRSEDQQ